MNNRFALLLSAIAISSIASMVAQPAPVALAPQKMPAVGTVDERFQSYNIEMVEVTGGRFWAPYKAQTSAPADTQPSGPAGMPSSLFRYRTPIDLSNPRLRNLAKALGPAYVRVSGTWANSTFFQDSDDTATAKPPAGFNAVLTRAQWRGVLFFSRAVNAHLVTSFAISPGARDANGVWTPAEAEKILRFTTANGESIAAAELFNEPTYASIGGAPKDYDAADYGRDFQAFLAFMKKASPTTRILGPGSVGEGGSLSAAPGMTTLKSEDILREQGSAADNALDAFSYHFYGAVSQRCAPKGAPAGIGTSPEAALSDTWLNLTARDETFYAALRDRFAPGKPLWLTETGETACGGDPWAASFIDSFRYLNQLGILARKGVKVVMHNTLAASDYGLLDETTLEPRPNYWAAVLWRKFMDTTVLDPRASQQPGLYVYAHCLRGTPGGVALLAINADKNSTRTISLPKTSSRYTLTAPDLLGSTVQLNGAELHAAADGTLPSLTGKPQPAGAIELAPVSITFLAIPTAKNQTCH